MGGPTLGYATMVSPRATMFVGFSLFLTIASNAGVLESSGRAE